MGCNHKKENRYLWCNACAKIAAGIKPSCKWKHGDYAMDKYNSDEIYKVLDSEMNIVGISTETPKWEEWLIFRDGGGSAPLFQKMKFVKAD